MQSQFTMQLLTFVHLIIYDLC